MRSASARQTIPWRWHLAGLLRKIPEFRGRDRLSGLILQGCRAPRGLFDGSFGPNLRYRARYDEDGSLQDLFFLQYEEPSLVAILEAVLEPDGVFFDVGANIGVYTGWAARTVGPTGRVYAFEPVPSTRQHLREFLHRNHLKNVSVIPSAVGRETGSLHLYCHPGASGLASAVKTRSPGVHRIEVRTTSLDEYAGATKSRLPQLLKIDVEGYELEVLRGARRILSSPNPPVVIFEAEARQLARARVRFNEIVSWLGHEVGFRVYGLTRKGLLNAGCSEEPLSLNSLALHPSSHGAVFDKLRHRRFRRNQNC